MYVFILIIVPIYNVHFTSTYYLKNTWLSINITNKRVVFITQNLHIVIQLLCPYLYFIVLTVQTHCCEIYIV